LQKAERASEKMEKAAEEMEKAAQVTNPSSMRLPVDVGLQ
jgi:hypothetical protein